jgi:glycosyltransferase involved in cell wall biosynthesis
MTRVAPASDMPLVSIVTPTYNRKPYLRWTINSLRNQTYPNIEHIVVDGASTDGTLDLLREVEPTYRMRWTSGPDAGMYHAINAGLAEATGEILAYLNSDDLYFPWTVQTIVDAFQANPEADFIYGDAIAVDDETGNTIVYWMMPFDLDFIQRMGFLAQPAVFWRRRAFEAIGPFDASLRYIADCEYWMRAGATHKFVKVDEFVAVERLHRTTLREAVGGPLWRELADARSRYVILTGPDHDLQYERHIERRNSQLRRYKWRMLVQSFIPRSLRTGPWKNILNSGLIKVERLRYILRGLKVGKLIPGLRRWTAREFLRADPSVLKP